MAKIIYCGDTSAESAAAYLLGALTHIKAQIDYLPSDQIFSKNLRNVDLLILSDYPASNISAAQQQQIFKAVEKGMSLWMIGGWESYHGLHGEYKGTWSTILPVEVLNRDDRVNSYVPYVLNPVNQKHPILKKLPWEQAPAIGGFNQVMLKEKSKLLLSAIPFYIQNKAGKLKGKQGEAIPMLVEGSYGQGKTLALMTDLAPHWVGGFVDWGDTRVVSHGKASREVETGHLYLQFIVQTVTYLLAQKKRSAL